MVKIHTDDKGRRGFKISTEEFENIEEIIVNNKKCYFIVNKIYRTDTFVEDVKKLIVNNLTKKDIYEHLGKSRSWLDNRLKEEFGTSDLKILQGRMLRN